MAKKKKHSTFKTYIKQLKSVFAPKQEILFENELRELFKKRWKHSGNPGSGSPDLLAVKLRVEFHPERTWKLISTAEIWINYHGKYCCKEVSIVQPMETGRTPTYQGFEDMISDSCRKIAAELPGCVKSLPDMYTHEGYNKFVRKFSMVRDHISEELIHTGNGLSFTDVVQQVSKKICESDDERASYIKEVANSKIKALGVLPNGTVIADPINCTVCISNGGNHMVNLQVTLSANFPEMPHPTNSVATRKTLDMFEPFYYKGDAALTEIENSIKAASKEAISELMNNFPICRIPFESLPNTLVSIMSRKGVWYGKVHAVCSDYGWFHDAGICNYIAKDEIQFVTGFDYNNKKSTMSLKEMLKSDAEPIKLGSKKAIPKNMVAFNKLCEAAGKLYESFSDKRVKRMPTLEFIFSSNKAVCKWDFGSVSIKSLFDSKVSSDKTIRKRLMELFQEVADSEVVWQDRAVDQAKVLATLNPSEFAALRFIVESKKSWYTEINNRLESSVLTTKVSMGPYLDHLCEITFKDGGEETHLLTFNWQSSRKHGDFRIYKSPVKWAEGVFDMAKPRSFTLEEMDDMTADGREKFFQMSLKQASNDSASKWRVLNILERMSKQYAAEFAKTEEGDKFLRSFEGDDALYVRFFLESLPGCKRLAAKMFPDNE